MKNKDKSRHAPDEKKRAPAQETPVAQETPAVPTAPEGAPNAGKSRVRLAFEVFLVFLKIGAFTFGGGYAMIALIEREIAERKKYVTKCDILDIVAVAESTPGPIAINMATFVGYRTAGVFGAFCATLGVVLPSFCIIFALSFVLRSFQNVKQVRWAFYGIRAAVLALIVKGWVSMAKACPKSLFSLIIAICSLVCAILFEKVFGFSVLWIIAAAALCGLVFSVVRGKVAGRAKK